MQFQNPWSAKIFSCTSHLKPYNPERLLVIQNYLGMLEMKYTKEICDHMVQQYNSGVSVPELAQQLDVPERSIIAKLSSLGVYQKKSYLNKRGEIPVKKSEHIERIAVLLNTNLELLESLEKVNKTVLVMIERALSDPKSPQDNPEWT
jgi:hypothetical protein